MQPTLARVRTADGVSIAWTSSGSGPAPLHLPGVPLSNLEAEWRIPVLRRAYATLDASLRLVQYDGRGTGRSQRDVDDVSLEGHLRDLDAVVAATGEARFVLLGFYHSATHAIAYAARHPDRVRGLILFGGATRGWSQMSGPGTQALLSLIERDWDTFVESATHAWLGWPDDEEGRLAADWFRTATSPAVARATMEAAKDIDVTGAAARVQCPALVLHREHATVIPLELSRALAAALPDGRLELIPGSSASLFFEAGDEVARRIVRFVLDPAAPAAAGGAVSRAGGPDQPGGVSAREVEVLRLLAAGDTNGQIAARLGLSVNTVERHVANLYRKIDARGRAEASAWAVRRGIA
jgi:pimeloyl-ACP methyl ester carboxylesterase/DNA-binding CsgD family transcriptional regulator